MNWPSVTGVLKAAGFYAQFEQFGRPEALARGTWVHAAANLLGENTEIQSDWLDRHPECLPYIAAYRKFLAETRFQLIESAFEIRHEDEKYIGHIDQLGSLPGVKARMLIDLKSGSCPDFTRLQLAGYVEGLGDRTIRRAGLLLKRNGRYKLIPYDRYQDFDEWLQLVRNWWSEHGGENDNGN